jgi:hypothetical protein
MKYYFFIDETWDHSLSNINEDFPYFLLCWVLISEVEYKKITEQVQTLKYDFFSTHEVILHSRDIRKCDKAFSILFDLKVKEDFYKRLNKVIWEWNFEIIAIGIRKEEYIKKYGKIAENPYQVSLSYMLERLVFCMWNNENTVDIIVEKRGKKEDAALLEYYNKVYSRGTFYIQWPEFNKRITSFDFRWKHKNDIGIQLADLCAYPLVSYIRNPKEPNPAFDILKPKIYQKEGKLYGFKIHP